MPQRKVYPVARMRKMEDEGMSRAQIAKHFNISSQRLHQIMGKRPDRDVREHRVYVDPETFDRVADIAKSFGFIMTNGPNYGKGSVHTLLNQIGKGNLIVQPKEGSTIKVPPVDS